MMPIKPRTSILCFREMLLVMFSLLDAARNSALMQKCDSEHRDSACF